MTPQEPINQTRDVFEKTAKKYITRDGITEMLLWLAGTDFYKAPASTQYHGTFEGGLVTHCLNVHIELTRINQAFGFGFDPESMAIVALFHDLCKVGCYKNSTRNVKNEKTGAWEKVPFYKFEEDFKFGGHGSKSVFMTQHFITLTPEEGAAINCHMGPWDRQDYGNPGGVYEVNKLAWALHVADEAASYIEHT